MEKKITFQCNKIYGDGKLLFEVPYPIETILSLDNLIIVIKQVWFLVRDEKENKMIYSAEPNYDHQNVYAYDHNGKLIWQIGQFSTEYDLNELGRFTNIYWNVWGIGEFKEFRDIPKNTSSRIDLRVRGWDCEVVIDPLTGNIKEVFWTK